MIGSSTPTGRWTTWGRAVAGNRRLRRGMTLLEVMLAMGILVLVSSMTFWFYSSALATSQEGTDAARRLRLVRIMLHRIATEIRQASVMTADNRVGIEGDAERIRLSSFRVPSREPSKLRGPNDEPPPAEYDLTKVEYKIARHPEILHPDGYEMPLGLARVEVFVPRPQLPPAAPTEAAPEAPEEEEAQADGFLSADEEEELFGDSGESDAGGLGPQIDWEELYAPELRYLRFCFFDGHKWWDRWEMSGESPLPQAVQVTIGFEMHPPFGEKDGLGEPGEINTKFCTCLNEDPVDCVPLGPDQLATVVRVPQADPLFRSRVRRETQSLLEELSEAEAEQTEGTAP